MSSDADGLPALPRDDDGPVFREPWQAEAFALAVRLHEQGAFTWREWTVALGREIRAAEHSGDADPAGTYYDHWVGALSRLLAEKGVVGLDELDRRAEDWQRAYLATPHGNPVELRSPRW